MKTHRSIALLGAGVLAATLLTACASEEAGLADDNCEPAHDVQTIDEGKLIVSAHVYPPFSDFEGDTLTGFEGELITQIAAMECLEVVPMQTAIPSIVTSITTARADTAIGVFYRTEERSKIVTLGDPVISDSMVLVSHTGVAEIDDLPGLKVGSALGYLWEKDLQDLLGDDFVLYPDLQAVYADFDAGRIDVLIDTAPSASYRLDISGVDADILIPSPDDLVGASREPGQTQFMTSLENAELGAAISANVEKLRADGVIKELLLKWGLPEEIGEPGEPNLL